MDNPEIKTLIDKKLEKAKTGKRVSALKSQEAIKATNLDEKTKAKLNEVADAQTKARGRIKRPTAILVDKSASMSAAIEVGKRLGALISSVSEADLFVYAFDGMPYPIECKSDKLTDWEKAFQGIRSGGNTGIGCGVLALCRNKQAVEQIIVVSDGGENQSPSFADAYAQYVTQFSVRPTVCFVRVPGSDSDRLSANCRAAHIECDVYDFNERSGADYMSLPGIISFLSKPSKLDLLMSIMEFPLPVRRTA